MVIAPQVLSVEDAGRVLGIGRTLAYEQARAWIATGGVEGFPCRRVGRLLRVYRPELEGWLGFAIEWPLPEPETEPTSQTGPARTTAIAPASELTAGPTAPKPHRSSRRSGNRISANQTSLPFTG